MKKHLQQKVPYCPHEPIQTKDRSRTDLKYTLRDFWAILNKQETKYPKLSRVEHGKACALILKKMQQRMIEDLWIVHFPYRLGAFYVRENPNIPYEEGMETGKKFRLYWHKQDKCKDKPNREKYMWHKITGNKEDKTGVQGLNAHVKEVYYDRKQDNYRSNITL